MSAMSTLTPSRRRPSLTALVSGLLLALFTLPGAAGAQTAAETVRTLDQDLPTGDVRALKAKLPLGDLTIEPGASDRVEITTRVYCGRLDRERCRRAAENIRLDWRTRRHTLVVKIVGTPRGAIESLSVDTLLRVPARLPMEVDVAAGDVTVRGLENDLEVDVGTGDVHLALPRTAVRSVEIDVGAGRADLLVAGSRVAGSGLLRRGLKWSQAGGVGYVEVDVGAGDVEVNLQ